MKLNYLFTILLLLSIISIIFLSNNHSNNFLNIFSKPLIPFIKSGNFLKDIVICRSSLKILLEKHVYMKITLEQANYFKNENNRLRELLNLQKNKNMQNIIIAEIIGGDLRTNKYFRIDKGLNQGIKSNMPVMFLKGIIGKISASFSDNAIVETYNNINYKIGITDASQSFFSIAEYYSMNMLKAIISNSIAQNIKINDTIYSSGLASIYPAGIPLGFVNNIITKRTGEVLILIEPLQNIPPGNFVFIMRNEHNNMENNADLRYKHIGSIGWFRIIKRK